MSDTLLFGLTFLAPWALLAANALLLGGRRKFALAVIATLVVYACVQLSAYFAGAEAERDLMAFDMNGDGVFTADEGSPGLAAAMERYSSDTGIAMAPITGAIFALIYVPAVFSVWVLAANVAARVKARRP